MRKINNPNQLLLDFDVIEKDLFLLGDIHNIRNMLPQLYDTQIEDVSFAEKRFQEGKGYLYTNGTGTGKTFVGLGNAKRFYARGKKNILIVVPTDKKCVDWIEDGLYIGLIVYQLVGTNDAGKEITVTTYANFYNNDALNTRHWDLIIYDESHYLNQNSKGTDTVYLNKHRHVANLPSTARQKAFDIVGPKPQTEDYAELKRYRERYLETVNELVQSTKVIFLSATPFAYHKSIQYADGCLFDIDESIEPRQETSYSYNESSGFESFLCSNFGYRMRYNKVTVPESGVDQNLMERNFFESHVEKGVMSTRQLQLEYDYSRHFVTIDSEIGDFINSGIELFYNTEFKEKYKYLHSVFNTKYNYNYVNQLLEVIKAQQIPKRIQEHLDLNRKIVLFHGYNHSVIEHPFQYESYKLLTEENWHIRTDLDKNIEKFRKNYPQYWNLNLSSLKNTREAIKKHFPWAREFNGIVNKKLRNQYIREFNDDNSGMDLIIIQEKAGREGISAHDKTGYKQRVLMNLGLPTAPTSAIQIEGRIYREGLKSNAVYEYITVQTTFEREAFGTKIAQRSKTAENLAMGNLARDLETAFKEGYLNSSYEKPSLLQGTGGKDSDKFLNSISEFDKAKTFYFSRQKKTSKNKSSEGIDYFATPEPLGYKMVEWLNPKPDKNCLEPSAGHGAIARFFPHSCNNTFIEPSAHLSSELSVNAKGRIETYNFESLSVINKYDYIAMNPPFGTGGKMAIEHLQKALFKHLKYGGQLFAIIPMGSSTDKRFMEMMNDNKMQDFIYAGELLLPSITFSRAGTTVMCRIVKFMHKYGSSFERFNRVDISYIDNIEEFFETLETLDF